MITEYLPGKNGYAIPCRHHLQNAPVTLLICHGFASSKTSPMVQLLEQQLLPRGVDLCAFDFPAHGDSHTDGHQLRMAHCLSDLQCVEDTILSRAPHTRLFYFASSFGAYTLLVYLATRPHRGERAFLRATAVDMFGIVQGWLQEMALSWIPAASGWVQEDICPLDAFYNRNFFITRGFWADLRQFDLFTLYPNANAGALTMIHGANDSTARPEHAVRFAAQAGANLHMLPHAEHRLMDPGEPEALLDLLLTWLSSP